MFRSSSTGRFHRRSGHRSTRLSQLILDDPEKLGVYDKDADQWSATFGNGQGFILYAISHARIKVMLLRILSI